MASGAVKRIGQNRGAVISAFILVFLILAAIFAPLIVRHSPFEIFGDSLQVPPLNRDFWLGTDDLGRDLLSRLLFGARLSLGLGFLAVLVSMVVGTPLGLIAGFFGGRLDLVIVRFTDMMMAIPNVLLAIVLVAILGTGLVNTVLAVALVSLPNVIRVVRAAVMSEREKLYIQAAKSYGARRKRQIFFYILPNCMAPLIVQATLGFSDAILNAAALGFLGLGAQPPAAEWGVMLADGRPFIESAWWLVTLPGVCILISSLCFNLLGDGLREALDPRLR